MKNTMRLRMFSVAALCSGIGGYEDRDRKIDSVFSLLFMVGLWPLFVIMLSCTCRFVRELLRETTTVV